MSQLHYLTVTPHRYMQITDRERRLESEETQCAPPPRTYSPATTYEEALRRAARVWGVQEEYWDILGNAISPMPEIERSILRSMGFKPDSSEV